jgi:hypothetical protein
VLQKWGESKNTFNCSSTQVTAFPTDTHLNNNKKETTMMLTWRDISKQC